MQHVKDLLAKTGFPVLRSSIHEAVESKYLSIITSRVGLTKEAQKTIVYLVLNEIWYKYLQNPDESRFRGLTRRTVDGLCVTSVGYDSFGIGAYVSHFDSAGEFIHSYNVSIPDLQPSPEVTLVKISV